MRSSFIANSSVSRMGVFICIPLFTLSSLHACIENLQKKVVSFYEFWFKWTKSTLTFVDFLKKALVFIRFRTTKRKSEYGKVLPFFGITGYGTKAVQYLKNKLLVTIYFEKGGNLMKLVLSTLNSKIMEIILKSFTKVNRQIFAIAFLFLTASKMFSQAPLCNYHIQNSTNCTIDVTVKFYDSFGVCTVVNNPTLASNTPWFPTCGGTCGPIVEVEVILNNAGGCTPTGSGIVSSANTSDTGGFAGTCLCGTSSNYNMNWYYNHTNIQ